MGKYLTKSTVYFRYWFAILCLIVRLLPSCSDIPTIDVLKGLARVALGALFIGCFLGAAIQWILFVPAIRQFALYVTFLFTFHLLEFIMTAIFHPR
jgi:high-affinity Fe2+/Pb2+ permease